MIPGAEQAWLREALERHVAATASPRARYILERWPEPLPLFRRVAPRGAPANAYPAPWAAPALPASAPRIQRLARHWRRSWRELLAAGSPGARL